MHDRIASLLAHPAIQAARDHLEGADASILARQAELSAIPAPTGGEGARAARVAELFRAAGLPDVTVDVAGNVLAWNEGSVLLRLEADVTRDEAVRIALSTR